MARLNTLLNVVILDQKNPAEDLAKLLFKSEGKTFPSFVGVELTDQKTQEIAKLYGILNLDGQHGSSIVQNGVPATIIARTATKPSIDSTLIFQRFDKDAALAAVVYLRRMKNLNFSKEEDLRLQLIADDDCRLLPYSWFKPKFNPSNIEEVINLVKQTRKYQLSLVTALLFDKDLSVEDKIELAAHWLAEGDSALKIYENSRQQDLEAACQVAKDFKILEKNGKFITYLPNGTLTKSPLVAEVAYLFAPFASTTYHCFYKEKSKHGLIIWDEKFKPGGLTGLSKKVNAEGKDKELGTWGGPPGAIGSPPQGTNYSPEEAAELLLDYVTE